MSCADPENRNHEAHEIYNVTYSDESWIAKLSSDGAEQAAALIELSSALDHRLRCALGNRLSGRNEFLEDITQEAVLKVLQSLDQFQGRSKFMSWATTIAVRTAFTELRRRRWKDVSLEEVTADAGDVAAAVDSRNDSDTVTEWQRLVNTMYQIVNTKLSTKQRDALLAELKGMPQEEIGRRMGSNRNAVYKLTHDARKQLKRHLEAAGYSSAEFHSLLGETR